MTTFADGVYQFGGSPVGGMPYSWLQGTNGKTLFVAPWRSSSGTNLAASSDGNPGTFKEPLKTITAAYNLCTTGLGSVIYVIADSNTTANTTDDLSATLTWAKDAVHLIGLCPPTIVSQRARINQLSSATGVSPMINVTGNANVFANMQFFQGVADATSLINVQVTGQRNVFDNVHFAGIGHATMSAAGCCSLKLDGAAENVFRRCVIGVDTATMDGDGTNLLCDTAATRNLFEDCLFQAFISATAASHVTLADATAIDRWLWFKNCQFISESTNKTVDMAEVFNIPASPTQGKIVLQNCSTLDDGGAPVWSAGTEGIIWANMAAPTASALPWPIKQTVSSATRGAWIPLNILATPYNVAIGCVCSSNINATYAVEYAHDSPLSYVPCKISSSTTTATLTLVNHGLTTSDSIIVVGSGNANLDGTFQVAGVTDQNIITYTITSTTTTSISSKVAVMRVFTHSTITGKTANSDGNIAFPVGAVRLRITSYSAGYVTMLVNQAGIT